MSVVKFEKPAAKKPDPKPDPSFVEPEVTLKMTEIEEAKIWYAAGKLGVPVDFPYEVVKWPWQANTSAYHLGIVITEDGEVRMRDDNLEKIQARMRSDRALARLTWVAVFGLLTYCAFRFWSM
jgi:hypothetical protein